MRHTRPSGALTRCTPHTQRITGMDNTHNKFTITGNKLYKAEKLCSTAAVSRMFASGHSFIVYPLRVVYIENAKPLSEQSPAVRFMITIPKKRVRRAVKRVLMRRRIRESYRLNRGLIIPPLESRGLHADVAFIYLDSTPAPYAKINERMQEALVKVAEAITAATDGTPTTNEQTQDNA